MSRNLRLAKLNLPIPLESAIQRAGSHRDRATQHEALVVAWELAIRIMGSTMLTVCRHVGARSKKLDDACAALDRPSTGVWIGLTNECCDLLRAQHSPAALAMRATLGGLEQQFPRDCGLQRFADRIGLLPNAVRGLTTPRAVLGELSFYRNKAQSTHAEIPVSFREQSVPALLDGLLDFCERVPLTGEYSIIVFGRSERTSRGSSIEVGRLSGGEVSWDALPLTDTLLRNVSANDPYLLRDPDLLLPLTPLAAIDSSRSDWKFGWYARRVHAGTISYDGAARGGFQLKLEQGVVDALLAKSSGEPEPPADQEFLQLDPYRGLLRYDREHAGIFFGREEETDAAIARIGERGSLFVYGASGSGKSSWIRAGVIPAMSARASASGRKVLPLVFESGERPIAALRGLLAGARTGDAKDEVIWKRLVEDSLPDNVGSINSRALARLLEIIASDRTPILFVDQLEDLSMSASNAAESRAFLDLLATAAQSALSVGAAVIMSARADSFGVLLESESMRHTLEQFGWPLGPIPPEGLARVIDEPLRGRHVTMEPGLAEMILSDVGAEPGALALLSQVLATIWETRSNFDGKVTRRGYEAAGRVAGALKQQAEAAQGEALAVTPDAQPQIDRLFRGLATNNAGRRFTRRRVRLETLASELDSTPEKLRRLALPFQKRHLVVLSVDRGQETIEVAHERLFEAWPHLAEVLASQREALNLRREVGAAATAWEEAGRKHEHWSDANSKLRRAEELLAAGLLDLDDRNRDFLRASRSAVERRRKTEHMVLAGVVVLAVTLGVMVIFLNDATAKARSSEAAERASADALKEERTKLIESNVAIKTLSEQLEHQLQRANNMTVAALSLQALRDMRDLYARADRLWPVTPGKMPEMRRWIDDAYALIHGKNDGPNGRPVILSLDAHKERLEEIKKRGLLDSESGSLRFTSKSDQLWYDALTDLVNGLTELDESIQPEEQWLHAVGGTELHGWSMPRRIKYALRAEQALQDAGEVGQTWNATIDAIADDPRYAGLPRLKPQLNLVPLGPDPLSHLQEFADIQTGDAPKRRADRSLAFTANSGIVFVLLPTATFSRGASPGAPGVSKEAIPKSNESPLKEVTVTAYFISKYELTQSQWMRIKGTDEAGINAESWKESFARSPGLFSLLHPIENLPWLELNAQLSHLSLRMPTEDEWEYAARAGDAGPWGGADRSKFSQFANVADRFMHTEKKYENYSYDASLDDGYVVHAPVGSFRPNAYGLYDMLGNVSEFCSENYVEIRTEAASSPAQADPWDVVARRGGSYRELPSCARVTQRDSISVCNKQQNVGVRPARSIE